jgi:hypothetical protein
MVDPGTTMTAAGEAGIATIAIATTTETVTAGIGTGIIGATTATVIGTIAGTTDTIAIAVPSS